MSMATLTGTPDPIGIGTRVVIEGDGPFVGAAGRVTDWYGPQALVRLDEPVQGFVAVTAHVDQLIRSPYQGEPLEAVPSA